MALPADNEMPRPPTNFVFTVDYDNPTIPGLRELTLTVVDDWDCPVARANAFHLDGTLSDDGERWRRLCEEHRLLGTYAFHWWYHWKERTDLNDFHSADVLPVLIDEVSVVKDQRGNGYGSAALATLILSGIALGTPPTFATVWHNVEHGRGDEEAMFATQGRMADILFGLGFVQPAGLPIFALQADGPCQLDHLRFAASAFQTT